MKDHEPLVRRTGDVVEAKLWVFLSLVGLIVLLLFMLWSAMRGREVQVGMAPAGFPRLGRAGSSTTHLAYHFQGTSVSAVDLLHRIVFVSARRELWIENPYLALDTEVLELLAGAAERGVDVRLVLPGPNTDAQIVRHAGHRHFAELLRRGVRIFEYQPTLNHQKVMVVDRLWSHVGSTNLDNRSFESNDEVSLGIVDAGIAAQLRRSFLADLERSREVTVSDWQRERWTHRLIDRLSWPLNDLY